MRRREPGAPEELPVLTDLVVEEIEMPSLEFSFDAPPATAVPAASPKAANVAPPVPPLLPEIELDYVTLDEIVPPAAPAMATVHAERLNVPAAPALMPVEVAAPSAAAAPSLAAPPAPTTPTAAIPNVREQFNAQIVLKLDEIRHAVFNQAMQQLELHADGGLKQHLRESLTERLVPVVEDIVNSVIEETTQQVREIVARAVDAEIARMREQLSRKR